MSDVHMCTKNRKIYIIISHVHTSILTHTAMGPFYSSLCSELGREVDTDLLSELEAANKAELAKLEEGIEDATKNFGETEQRDALMAKAEYLCKIGDKVREGGDCHAIDGPQ